MLVQVLVSGVRKNGLPGQVSVPAQEKSKTSWFLVNLVSFIHYEEVEEQYAEEGQHAGDLAHRVGNAAAHWH